MDSDQSIDQLLSFLPVADLETGNIDGDIEEQVGEKGNLKYLVECDQLEASQVIGFQHWRWTIRFGAMCQDVHGILSIFGKGGEVVVERKVGWVARLNWCADSGRRNC